MFENLKSRKNYFDGNSLSFDLVSFDDDDCGEAGLSIYNYIVNRRRHRYHSSPFSFNF